MIITLDTLIEVDIVLMVVDIRKEGRKRGEFYVSRSAFVETYERELINGIE